jgi:hypothetical protein
VCQPSCPVQALHEPYATMTAFPFFQKWYTNYTVTEVPPCLRYEPYSCCYHQPLHCAPSRRCMGWVQSMHDMHLHAQAAVPDPHALLHSFVCCISSCIELRHLHPLLHARCRPLLEPRC